MIKKTALFSLYKTENVQNFAKDLINQGWKIVGTAETVKILKKNRLPVQDIKDFVGFNDNSFSFPPTLHPRVEAALTQEGAKKRIDLVYDIPYPLSKGIDIGGHALVALAVKGNRVPVMSKQDMGKVIGSLKNNKDIDEDLKKRLQEKAVYNIIVHYNKLLNRYKTSERFIVCGKKYQDLLNGENPYQVPAYIYEDEFKNNGLIGLSDFTKVSGEAPCFTNLADFDSILRIMLKISSAFYKYYKKIPYITVAAKHGNPCGLAADWKNPLTCVKKALWGNPTAIWGGEVIMNFKVSKEIADVLFSSQLRKKVIGNDKWMLDIVAAVDFEKKSIEKLGKRKYRKLYRNKALGKIKSISQMENTTHFRNILKGFLLQPEHSYVLDFEDIAWNTKKDTKNNIADYLISWVTAYHSFHGGNEVAISSNSRLIGVGGGPSTVDAAKIAVARAKDNKHKIKGSVFAADAFFPHIDAIKILIEAGCKSGIAPSGGIKEEQEKEFLRKRNILFGTIASEFRGFCRH